MRPVSRLSTALPPLPHAVDNKITLAPGKIYKIENISFNQDKVTMLDNQVLCVEVSVTVQDWEIVDVENPEFGD